MAVITISREFGTESEKVASRLRNGSATSISVNI